MIITNKIEKELIKFQQDHSSDISPSFVLLGRKETSQALIELQTKWEGFDLKENPDLNKSVEYQFGKYLLAIVPVPIDSCLKVLPGFSISALGGYLDD